MEDIWLEAMESISAGKGSQGVLFFPLRVIVQFLEIGQVFSQVPDPVMGIPEALYFGAEGFVSLLSDSEVDHQGKHHSREEGVCLFTGEDLSGVGVLPRPEWVQMTGTVASLQQEEFGIVREEVVSVEGGFHQSSSQSGNGVIVLWRQPFNVSMPVISGYNPKFFHDFRGQRVWTVVKVWRW
jgi:hypothetical protein